MSRDQAPSSRDRGLLLVLLAVVAALLPTVPAGAAAGGTTLTVMTRTLYGLDNTVMVTTFPDFIAAVTQDWANAVATDFPTRADALADEIVSSGADVVGLQEVALWRDQTPSDLVTGATTGPNATHVAYDFLALLQAALASRLAPYVAVATSTNADVEAPRQDSSGGFTDVRLTDRDVLLVRASLAPDFGNARSGHYLAQFSVTNGTGTPVTFTRGWTSADYRRRAHQGPDLRDPPGGGGSAAGRDDPATAGRPGPRDDRRRPVSGDRPGGLQLRRGRLDHPHLPDPHRRTDRRLGRGATAGPRHQLLPRPRG
jgi:hypothetical protein